jgi:type VI secretion system secreted protein VgrG
LTLRNKFENKDAPTEERELICNRRSALRKKIPFRRSRGYNSRPARMPGPQTAKVVGPAGEEVWCDEYGRVLVQFPWDRRDYNDDRASCWVRVNNPLGGGQMGGMFLPRIGQEVVVDFLNGDPDMPVVMGRFYNADNMPPWPLPEAKNQMGLYSRSIGGGYDNSNAFRFDDTPGKEEVWLRAEKDQRIEVEGGPRPHEDRRQRRDRAH